MRYIFLLLTILFSFSSCGKTNLTETEKLASLGKVWGFLKYYHPNVAEGKFNWDNQLFEILPKVKNATDKEDLSEVYLKWIESLGVVEDCIECVKSSKIGNFNKNFNLDWINDDTIFTKDLSEKLKFIEANRHQGEKYFASLDNYRGNIKITNEEPHTYDWENEQLRLLTLYRYWNIIVYFFPYKYQTDIKWDNVLYNMIPKFLNPESEIDFNLAMLELVVSIDDSHADLVTKTTNNFFGFKWIPAKFKVIDEKAIITGFYNDSLALINDLRIGDIVTKVDGRTIESIYMAKEKYISGSNQPHKKVANYTIFNGTTDSINIEFSRNNRSFKKSIKRYLFSDFNYKWLETGKSKILNDNIGYVNMGEIEKDDVAKTMNSLSETKAIIFDIRNYPNEAHYAISSYITSSNKYFYNRIIAEMDYPGKFRWENEAILEYTRDLKFKGQVILLVNSDTQSNAEFTTMLFQTGDNVITIGNQTSGADGTISRFDMVGGFKTKMTGVGIFYPDGTEAQRNGVKIDIVVQPTIQGIIDGKDEILEKAIEIANNQNE